MIIYSYRNHEGKKRRFFHFQTIFRDIQYGKNSLEKRHCVKSFDTTPQTTWNTAGGNIGGELNRSHYRNVKESEGKKTKWRQN